MTKQTEKAYVLKPGSKLARMYDWIKAQMVGTELIFTREHIEQVMAELDIKLNTHVYDLLRTLNSRGHITRTKRSGKDRGFIIALPDSNAASTPAVDKRQKVKHRTPKTASAVGELSVRELMNQLDGDIRRLEVELIEKRAFRKALGQVAGR